YAFKEVAPVGIHPAAKSESPSKNNAITSFQRRMERIYQNKLTSEIFSILLKSQTTIEKLDPSKVFIEFLSIKSNSSKSLNIMEKPFQKAPSFGKLIYLGSSNLLPTENPNTSKTPINGPPSLLAAQHINIIIGFSHLLIEVAFQVILVEVYHFRQDYTFSNSF
ncbi:1148_t:CDS:2, partial [Funneliformis mosseae]